MIRLEISQEDMGKPGVYENFLRLLNSLNDQSLASVKQEPVKVSQRRSSEQVGDPDIDPDVKARFGETIKKAKSLYFMSIIKRGGEVNSDEVERMMKTHYPTFTRKSIGGITGAINRWLTKASIALPYASRADQSRSGVHIFTWVQQEESEPLISDKERTRLTKLISRRNQKHFIRLLDEGRIGKDTVKQRGWADFSKEIVDLGTGLFENDGDQIIFKR